MTNKQFLTLAKEQYDFKNYLDHKNEYYFNVIFNMYKILNNTNDAKINIVMNKIINRFITIEHFYDAINDIEVPFLNVNVVPEKVFDFLQTEAGKYKNEKNLEK